MTLHHAPHASTRSPFGMRSCPRCFGLVVAPEASEFVSDRIVHHFWSCDSCGHDFETAVKVAERQAA